MTQKIVNLLFTFILLQNFSVYSINNALDDYYGNNTEYYNVDFSDINEVEWASEAVSYLAKLGVVTGNNGMFYPSNNITRDEFVKILILGLGLYDEKATCDFVDVPEDSWQYPYVSSAKKLGITSGINAREFGTGELITRQQMVTLAYNTAVFTGITFQDNNDNVFADFDKIDNYAVDAVNAFAKSGIVSGDESNSFNPLTNATRAEACKIIYSIITKNS